MIVNIVPLWNYIDIIWSEVKMPLKYTYEATYNRFSRIAASLQTKAYTANRKSAVVAISTAKILAIKHHLVNRFIVPPPCLTGSSQNPGRLGRRNNSSG